MTNAVKKIRQVKGEGVPGGGWYIAVLCRWTGWSSLVAPYQMEEHSDLKDAGE